MIFKCLPFKKEFLQRIYQTNILKNRISLFKDNIFFYSSFAIFQFKERFSGIANLFGHLLLYGYFIWLLTELWGRFNAYQGNYTRHEVFVYVAITELLFMTFLRSPFMKRSQGDFTLSLARPRSWFWMTFWGQWGATLGGRVLYLLVAMVILFLLGVPGAMIWLATKRLLWLMPLLGVAEAFMALLLGIAQIVWHEVKHLVLPITKIFLALGGVFGPLADYAEPGRSILLSLPASDLFFQVGHYCLRGTFFKLTEEMWISRVLLLIIVAAVLAYFLFLFSRRRHQSWGG